MGEALGIKLVTTMKATFFVLAVVLAAAHAGSSFSESDGVLCYRTDAGGNTMWDAGLGSSSCVQDPNAPTFYYKGKCDNKEGTYQIEGFSNVECQALDTNAPLT